MQEYRYIEDEFKSIVEAVSIKMLEQLKEKDPMITGVHYIFGPRIEIIETLTQKSKSNEYKFKKYPLVCLFTDIEEPMGFVGEYSDLRLNLAIIYGTKDTFKAEQRLENNFKPVIMPIYHALMNEISIRGNAFLGTSDIQNIKHTATRRYFWGTESIGGPSENVIHDFVDGLDIKNLQLKYYLNRC